MRDDFDPNWPHGHVTRNGCAAYVKAVFRERHWSIYEVVFNDRYNGPPITKVVGEVFQDGAWHSHEWLADGRQAVDGSGPLDLLNAPAPKPKPREDFDLDWPHGHITRCGTRVRIDGPTKPKGGGLRLLRGAFLLGDEDDEDEQPASWLTNGMYRRDQVPDSSDLVNAPAPKETSK